MKENTHTFLASMHSLEAKTEQLTREFRTRQLKDPGIILLTMPILSSYLK